MNVFLASLGLSLIPQSAPALDWIDLDDDGRLDRVGLVEGRLHVARNLGQRRFEPAPGLPTDHFADVLVTHLDADGHLDLYLVGPGPNAALLADGLGGFVDATLELGLADGGLGVSVRELDIDGDGTRDLDVQNRDGSVVFWRSPQGGFERESADGTTASPVAVTFGPERQMETEPQGAPLAAPRAPGPGTQRVTTIVAGAPGPGAPFASSGSTPRSAAPAGTADPALWEPACAESVQDASGVTCLMADSTPTLGRLYPMSADLNVDLSGNVGVGTTSPSERLSVSGVVQSLTGGFRFPDGTLQDSAAVAFPTGALILSDAGSHAGFDSTGLSLFAEGTPSWSALADMPAPRWRASSVVRNGKVYIVGGYDGVDWNNSLLEFDPATGVTIGLGPSSAGGRPALAVRGGAIHRMGALVNGIGASNQHCQHPTPTTTCNFVGVLPSPHYGAFAATIDGLTFLLGGFWQGAGWTGQARSYSPGTGWNQGSTAGTTIQWPAGAVLDGTAYVVGNGTALQSYDPASDTWTTLAPVPESLVEPAAVGLYGRLIVFAGGSDGVYEYDPVFDEWSTLPPSPFVVSGATAQAVGERIFLFGGDDGGPLATVHEYDRARSQLHVLRKN